MPPDDLRKIIDATGLSIREFAEYVLGRDERVVQTWLAGEKPPRHVLQLLERIEWVELRGHYLQIVVRRGPRTRRMRRRA